MHSQGIFIALALVAAGCAAPSAPSDGGLLDIMEARPDAPPIPPSAECVVTTGRAPADSRDHVPACSELDLDFVPPAGGEHYGVWADFGTYDAPVPWGFLIHSLEHGAVILAHDCEGDCPEVLDAFERIRAERVDPLCRAHDNGNRIIVVPAPDLDVPLAAIAWEHVYLATCLDEPSLNAFIDAHYGQAPENLCAPGATAAEATCP